MNKSLTLVLSLLLTACTMRVGSLSVGGNGIAGPKAIVAVVWFEQDLGNGLHYRTSLTGIAYWRWEFDGSYNVGYRNDCSYLHLPICP